MSGPEREDERTEAPSGQDQNQPIRALTDRSRVMGGSRMIRSATPEQVTDGQADTVIEAVREYINRTHITHREIAAAIDVSTSTVSEVLRRKYKGRWQPIIIALDRWLEDELKRADMPKPAEFVWTSVATEIKAVAEAAIHLGGIAVCYGEPGIGKTLAAKAVVAEKPGAVYCSMETTKATPSGVLHVIRDALDIRGLHRNYMASRFVADAIRMKLKGTSRLVVVDQVHRLCNDRSGDKGLYTLCDIHDSTGVPMLWLSTIDMVQYLERKEGPGREPLAQIRRRIALWRDLHERTVRGDGSPGAKLYTIAEIRKVFAKGQVRLADDAARFLCVLANLPGNGHLGDCSNLVIMATLTNPDATVLDAEMLRRAQSLLANRRSRAELERRFAAETGESMMLSRAG